MNETPDPASATPVPVDYRRRLGCCQICGRPNECRIETGDAYRGPCWCEAPTLSSAALHRLTADLPEARCLCPTCLARIEANPAITLGELEAIEPASPAEPVRSDAPPLP